MTSLLIALLIVWLVVGVYLWAKSQHRVVALGKDTYIRIYPNPGVGIRRKDRVYAASVVRGFEIMEWTDQGWRLVRSKFIQKFVR
jgi:hypothetical protein